MSKEINYRINKEITAPEVRIVGLEPAELNGIYPIEQALRMAEERGMDLVEIAPQANPPVCRIIEYSRLRFEQKKKAKEAKQKLHQIEVKEIRFRPHTDEHDLAFKVRHAENFLQEGNKIKATVFFRGRSIAHPEFGERLLREFAERLSHLAKVEVAPRLDGKNMTMVLAPLKPGKRSTGGKAGESSPSPSPKE
ncbi:MAG: translation initiation factor IF-3 [Bacteroidia bacterium]|nr:translation initiation factor IF-3 [Bacteroidia bacterium]MCX7763460.1 translation initiation factor IF-3 [Bacteroidia bacterium]MDW8058140.1 translation initiation factor IF-3 [Bacteroidia bacterium]